MVMCRQRDFLLCKYLYLAGAKLFYSTVHVATIPKTHEFTDGRAPEVALRWPLVWQLSPFGSETHGSIVSPSSRDMLLASSLSRSGSKVSSNGFSDSLSDDEHQ
jgi:hypothetical protein